MHALNFYLTTMQCPDVTLQPASNQAEPGVQADDRALMRPTRWPAGRSARRPDGIPGGRPTPSGRLRRRTTVWRRRQTCRIYGQKCCCSVIKQTLKRQYCADDRRYAPIARLIQHSITKSDVFELIRHTNYLFLVNVPIRMGQFRSVVNTV